jgi:hypothetical protein
MIAMAVRSDLRRSNSPRTSPTLIEALGKRLGCTTRFGSSSLTAIIRNENSNEMSRLSLQRNQGR